ncbi:MAG TPA: CBS domain-containing protein [Archaeoglobus profundus]|nr:CBS domain-containing protein [Archaeoglobus profundus]
MDIELKQLIKEEFNLVGADEPLSRILPILEKSGGKGAILVEEDGKIGGVIREKDLIRGSIIVNPHETKVKNFVVRTGILSLNDLTPVNVAKRFIEDSTPFVIVKLNGKYGIIDIDDFLNLIKPRFKDVKVRDIMNTEVITVKAHDTVAKALATMRSHGIDRVVVINDNNKVVGIVTGKDIIDRVLAPRKRAKFGELRGEKEETLSILVESVMSYPVITADKNDNVSEVIDKMIENNISSIVVTRDNIPEGILIKKDILEHFIKIESPTQYDIQVIIKNITLDEFEKARINDDLTRFMEKFKEFFSDAILFVYIRKFRQEYYRGLPWVYVRLKLASDRGTFFATGEGWGAEYAVHAALRRLEREVLKEKELLTDRKMLRRFYEDIFSEYISV